MCSYFFNFRIINAIFRPPKKLDLEQWPRPLFEVLGLLVQLQYTNKVNICPLSGWLCSQNANFDGGLPST